MIPLDLDDEWLPGVGLVAQPASVRRRLPYERPAPGLVTPGSLDLVVHAAPGLPVVAKLPPPVQLGSHPLLVPAAVGPDLLAPIDVVSLPRAVEEILPEVQIGVPLVPGLALPFRVVDVRDESAESHLVRGFQEADIVDVQLGRLPAPVHPRAPPASDLANVERAARPEAPRDVQGGIAGGALGGDDGAHDRSLNVVRAVLREEIEVDSRGVRLARGEFTEHVAIRRVHDGGAHEVEPLAASVELPPEAAHEIAREPVAILQQVVRLAAARDVGG